MVTKGAADNRYSLLECLKCIRCSDFLNFCLLVKFRAPPGHLVISILIPSVGADHFFATGNHIRSSDPVIEPTVFQTV
jgi:hypothetical protein